MSAETSVKKRTLVMMRDDEEKIFEGATVVHNGSWVIINWFEKETDTFHTQSFPFDRVRYVKHQTKT